jgi:hypothetical protein
MLLKIFAYTIVVNLYICNTYEFLNWFPTEKKVVFCNHIMPKRPLFCPGYCTKIIKATFLL